MIPRASYLTNLQLASSVINVPGCVVECGVWRGGMSAGLVSVLGKERDYFLFDSFEGLPPAKEIDGQTALEWQQDTASPSYHDNCAAPQEFAERAMRLSGAPKVHFHRGWFENTLPGFVPPCPIALLRLDGDWYDSTMTCLSALFDQVAPSGIIVIDDYFAWDGCSKAVHDFLSRRSALERLRNVGEVSYIVKMAPSS